MKNIQWKSVIATAVVMMMAATGCGRPGANTVGNATEGAQTGTGAETASADTAEKAGTDGAKDAAGTGAEAGTGSANAADGNTVATEPENDVVILFTSDVHCGVDQNFGYAGLQQAVETTKAAGNHVLLVDDGDSVQGEPLGSMTEGEADIRLMNQLKYDVAIPGNHEYDYGMEQFFKLVEMAEFPYISCNFTKDDELVFDPYIIKEAGDYRIGFVGVTTPTTIGSSNPRHFQDENGNYIYGFMGDENGEKVYNAVQKAVDDVRAEGADYVLLIAHLGNEAEAQPWTYADVISHTSGIDAVLDGHSHDTDKVVMLNKDGEEVIRQACGTKMQCIGWVRIDDEDGDLDTGLYTYVNDVPAPVLLDIQNEMRDAVAKETEVIDSQLSEVVAQTAVDLTINDPVMKTDEGVPIRIVRRAETNLGDLVTDALRVKGGADIAMVGGGSLRTGIPAGDITIKKILTTLPFGDSMAVVKVTGQQILDALEWGARVVPEENGAFAHVSGMTYEIHTDIPDPCKTDENGMFVSVNGERRVKNVMVGEEPLDPEKIYTIAGFDFTLVECGDGCTMFEGGEVVESGKRVDYTVIADYIREELGGVVGEEYADPYGQGRIIAVE